MDKSWFELNYSRKIIFLSLILFICVIISGCLDKKELQASSDVPDSRRLNITVKVNDAIGFTTITPEQLGGNFGENIVYLDLTDVCIEIDDSAYPLENAVRDSLITVEEICAYARIDARNGICEEIPNTYHSLTLFTYRYPEYDLQVCYDVYKTPDSKEHIISKIGIYKVYSRVYPYFFNDESEYNYAIDREDWGITFEVSGTSSTSITINCTQNKGQHIGQLVASRYAIFTEEYEHIQPDIKVSNGLHVNPAVSFTPESTTQFTITWEPYFGNLKPGTYYLQLNVDDIFDSSQVHPLIEDYYTSQSYWIPFTIS